ncbi:MAG: hypothetical protein Q4P06_00180 [Actinomycetaceae bacterium]|nr:hypothetical protein [Actinomycetaceae bacterium]
MKHSRPRGWIHDWEPNPDSTSDSSRQNSSLPPRQKDVTIWQGSSSTRTEGEFIDPVAVDPGVSQAPRAHVLTQSMRVAARVVDTPGRMLIRAALIMNLAVFLLGLIGKSAFGGLGWWIPLVSGLLGVCVTSFFTWRRHQLLGALDRSGPRNVWDEAGPAGFASFEQQGYGSPDSSEDRLSAAHQRAQEAGEAYQRARTEYRTRTARFFPRMEAASRALRASVEPGYEAAWLDHDFRPTLVAFFLVALSIPIGALLALLTGFALILQSLA